MSVEDKLGAVKALVGLMVAALNVVMMIVVSDSVKAVSHDINDQIGIPFMTGMIALISLMVSYNAVIERQPEVAFAIPTFTLIYISLLVALLTPDRYLVAYATLYGIFTLSLLLYDFNLITYASIWMIYASILIGAIYVAIGIVITLAVVYFALKKVGSNVNTVAVLIIALASVGLTLVDHNDVKDVGFIIAYIWTLVDLIKDVKENGISIDVFDNLRPRIKYILIKSALIIPGSIIARVDVTTMLMSIFGLIMVHSVVKPQRHN